MFNCYYFHIRVLDKEDKRERGKASSTSGSGGKKKDGVMTARNKEGKYINSSLITLIYIRKFWTEKIIGRRERLRVHWDKE